ncbi:MAG: hypothetical protein PHX62_01985 [Bacilli bacterium]|nr:hypothetical protein [Bacilli bacterium]
MRTTNPDSTKLSKDMDDYIKEMRATKFKCEVSTSNKEIGLDLNAHGKLLQSGIRLAEEGNGSAEVSGLKEEDGNLEEEIIKAVNLPTVKHVRLGKNDDENIKKLIKTTSDMLRMYRGM